jgi:hypothetical protein
VTLFCRVRATARQYGELSVRLAVKVPPPVTHRLAEKQLFAAYAIPSVHNFFFAGFGVRPGLC